MHDNRPAGRPASELRPKASFRQPGHFAVQQHEIGFGDQVLFEIVLLGRDEIGGGIDERFFVLRLTVVRQGEFDVERQRMGLIADSPKSDLGIADLFGRQFRRD